MHTNLDNPLGKVQTSPCHVMTARFLLADTKAAQNVLQSLFWGKREEVPGNNFSSQLTTQHSPGAGTTACLLPLLSPLDHPTFLTAKGSFHLAPASCTPKGHIQNGTGDTPPPRPCPPQLGKMTEVGHSLPPSRT